jgi:mannose-6-phosphate isomerase-like protein (cupin superfamily)
MDDPKAPRRDSISSPFSPQRTYVQLTDDGHALPIETGPDFWSHTVNQHSEGRLAFAYRFDRDTTTWEQHPQGEELVYVLSGAVDFVLELPDGEEVVELRGGEAYIVPRGMWHRQVVRAPGEIFFVTVGKGTQHRPV